MVRAEELPRHAVRTAEVATVRDRDAQVLQRAPQRVPHTPKIGARNSEQSRYSGWRVNPTRHDTEVTPLKRVIAISALLLGLGAFGASASASTACLNVHIDVNGTVVDPGETCV